MSQWRVLLKQIAAKPVVHGSEVYDERIDFRAIWIALDWLQAHRLVRSLGTGKTGFYCATVLGSHVATGIVPIERKGRAMYLRFPAGQLRRLQRYVDPQPGLVGCVTFLEPATH